MSKEDKEVDAAIEDEVVDKQLEEAATTPDDTPAAEPADKVDKADEPVAKKETDEPEPVNEPADADPDEDVEFTIPEDQKEFVKELLAGLTPTLQGMTAQIGTLNQTVDSLKKEVTDLKENEDKRFAEKAATTPPASMSGWMAERLGAAIGSDEAKLDYNEDRKLFNKSKDHEAEPEDVGNAALPPVLRKMIARQNGRGRVIPSTYMGQQEEVQGEQ